jgi:sugar phosphate isomerase/epimerase
MLDDFPTERRDALRDLLTEHALGVPALFMLGSVYTTDGAAHRENLDRMRVAAQLARDLGAGDIPVLAMGFGGANDEWEAIRGRMAGLLGDYVRVARAEDFILAAEAHSGAAVDRTERITWLLDAVHDPHVRLHFDIVHLFLAGEAIAECVPALVPYTAHTHITDARRHEDGSRELLLLGQGDLDSVAYLRAMDAAGWDDFITLEVSTMVWGAEGYDPVAAAQYSYDTLSAAFEEAGVTRG